MKSISVEVLDTKFSSKCVLCAAAADTVAAAIPGAKNHRTWNLQQSMCMAPF